MSAENGKGNFKTADCACYVRQICLINNKIKKPLLFTVWKIETTDKKFLPHEFQNTEWFLGDVSLTFYKLYVFNKIFIKHLTYPNLEVHSMNSYCTRYH